MSRRSRPAAATAHAGGAGGPLVAVCQGRRCSALRELAGGQAAVPELRDAVGGTRGAVLVTLDCPGACALAAVAAVAHWDGGEGGAGRAVWLSGVDDRGRAGALVEWVRAGGPPPRLRPDLAVPPALADAVVGVGPPPRLADGRRPPVDG
ncbi:hypothetical protein FHU33_3154 [Blastococcus colisei]|uniref:Uncharacterized protein n=1 Tax=Blastococcus colisei TaxID=1564162 RepID=A0A543PHX9_9ACTN|nr:hypothetical protein [Blastococcus colisei]TQN43693.1 hypothetical protein FHU33_3154 [Blastococcus colisei]